MTVAALKKDHLIDYLPEVRGRLTADAPLASYTWFRVGGPAEVLFVPADEADLGTFLKGKPDDIPVTIMGVGSNLLIRDGGISGLVIRLGRGFSNIVTNGTELTAGTAALDMAVARKAADAGIAGLEFLRGVPGTIGGALTMNAGAYSHETKDVLIEARAFTATGERVKYTPQELSMSYRHSAVPEGCIFTSALFRGTPGDPDELRARMADITAAREETQPVKSRTGGSTFKNPTGFKAWELIDQAGCRGLRMGEAEVSELHCNFLINLGAATASDLESLGEEVRRRVQDNSGVLLEWEIRRLGNPLGDPGVAP